MDFTASFQCIKNPHVLDVISKVVWAGVKCLPKSNKSVTCSEILLVYDHAPVDHFRPLLYFIVRSLPQIFLCFSSYPCRFVFLISQERNISAAMERRCFAFLSAFSTATLILSNLVFLGGGHVARIFWNRVFIQGKLPPISHIGEGTVGPFFFFLNFKCCNHPSAGLIHLAPVWAIFF